MKRNGRRTAVACGLVLAVGLVVFREDIAALFEHPIERFERLGKFGTHAWSVVFSPDGKTVYTGSMGAPAVEAWSVASGERVRIFSDEELEEVPTVSVSGDGRLLAASSKEQGGLRVWETATGVEVEIPPRIRETNFARAVFLSIEGESVLAVCQEDAIEWWRASSGPAAGFREGLSGVHELSRAHGENSRFAVADDSGVSVRELGTGGTRSVAVLSMKLGWKVNALALSRDGLSVAFADSPSVEIHTLGTDAAEPRRIELPPCLVADLEFSADGEVLVAALELREHGWDEERMAIALDVATGEELCRLPWSGRGYVWNVEFSPDGRTLAMAGEGGVEIWGIPER